MNYHWTNITCINIYLSFGLPDLNNKPIYRKSKCGGPLGAKTIDQIHIEG
jgi:hypothetical protein